MRARDDVAPGLPGSLASWPILLAGLLLLAAVWLVFRGALDHFLAQDDFVFLSRSAQVNSAGDWIRLFLRPDHFYRPLPRTVAFTLEWRLFGLEPAGYRWVSIVLHTANATLVLAICRLMTGRWLTSLPAALLYAAHPAHYVSVFWMSGQQELILAFTYLVAMLCYAGYLRTGRRFWYGGALLAFLGAILSKEASITLVIALPVMGLVWERNHGGARIPARLRLGALWPLLGMAGLAVVLRLTKTAGIPMGPYAPDLNPSHLLDGLRWFGMEMLSVRHVVGQRPLASYTVLAAALLVMVVLSRGKRSSAIITGLAMFAANLGFLLPFSQHRFAYYLNLPLAGLALWLAGVLANRVPARLRGRVVALVILATVATGAVCLGQQGVSRSIQQDPIGLISKGTIASSAVTRVQEQYSCLPEGSILYLTDSDAHRYWAVGLGHLFNILYGPDLLVRFDHLEPMTSQDLAQPGVYVFSLAP